jgi:hypothetical protein
MPAMNSDPHQSEPDHPDATAHPPLASATPHPPRRWWLKRIALAVVLFIAGFITLFVIWHRVADQRLQAAIDKIKAAGEPLYPEDFNTPPIPYEDNAAVLYRQAAELLTDERQRAEHDRLTMCMAWEADEDKLMSTCGALIASHEDGQTLIRKARRRAGVHWGLDFDSPLLDYIAQPLQNYRAMSKLLYVDARLQYQGGNHGEFVEILSDMHALAGAIDHQPMLVPHLTVITVNSLALSLVEEIGTQLAIKTQPGVNNSQAARPEAVQALIKQLLNEDAFASEVVNAFRFERAMQLDSVLMVASGKMATNTQWFKASLQTSIAPTHLLLGPLFESDGLWMMEHMSDEIEAIQSPSYPEYQDCMRRASSLGKRPAGGPKGIRNLLSSILMPSLGRAASAHYRALGQRRMAAIALAIRLFEVNRGHRPRTLDELVPDYLPTVPADPMSSNGVIQYLPNAEHPRLYSIGLDGIDDGGEYVYIRGGDYIDVNAADMPFFLDSKPPAPNDESDE